MLNPQFEGFEPPQSQDDALVIPRSFFERVIVGEPVSTVRVVAFILTRSLQGQAEVEASYTDLVRELRLCRQAVQEGLARAIEAGYIRQVQSGSNAHHKSRYAICWAKSEYSSDTTNTNHSNRETGDNYPDEAQKSTPRFDSQPPKYRAEKQTNTHDQIPYQSGNQYSSQHDSRNHSNFYISNQSQNNEIELETFLESRPDYLPDYPPANQPDRTPFNHNTTTASGSDTTLPFPAISSYLSNLNRDFSRELGDLAHTNSNRTQIFKLWWKSSLSEKEFAVLMYQARELTRRYAVRRTGEKEPAPGEVRNRMPYFFAVLRNLLNPLSSGGGKSDYRYVPPGTGREQQNAHNKKAEYNSAHSGYALADTAPAGEEGWRNFRGAEALCQQRRLQTPDITTHHQSQTERVRKFS